MFRTIFTTESTFEIGSLCNSSLVLQIWHLVLTTEIVRCEIEPSRLRRNVNFRNSLSCLLTFCNDLTNIALLKTSLQRELEISSRKQRASEQRLRKGYERWKICKKKKLISTKAKVNKDLQMGGKISLVAEEDLEVYLLPMLWSQVKQYIFFIFRLSILISYWTINKNQ